MKITRLASCVGKHRHASLGLAQAAIRSLERRGRKDDDERMTPYYCVFCRFYHIGHRGRSQWERERR